MSSKSFLRRCPKSVRTQNCCCKEDCRSNGHGQHRQRRQEGRQERRRRVTARKEAKVTTRTLFCWHCGKEGHQNVGQTPRTSLFRRRSTQRRQRKIEEQCWQGSVLFGTRRPGCRCGAAAVFGPARSLDFASFGNPGGSPHHDAEGRLRWTYDRSAAISAFRLDAKMGTETEENECSYKTASRELVTDRGGLCVQGATEYGHGVTFLPQESRCSQNSDQCTESSQ